MANPNLEDVIRDLAKRGELNHISLTPSRNGKSFRASFAMCSVFGISFAEDEDPVKAIIVACTTAKMKPQRASMKPQRAPKRSTMIEHEPAPASATTDEIDDLM